MTFIAREHSIEEGQPIYLYRFALNDKTWRFTSADGDITAGGNVWGAIPISDDGVSQTGEATSDALTITTTTRMEPARIYMEYPPSSPMSVAIFTTHEGDAEIRCIYIGEITSPNVPQPGTMVFTCETISATMRREGLRLGWQRNCPYALYDPVTCKVDKTAYGVAATITAMEGNLITIPAITGQPEDRFAGGFVEWLDVARGIERRGIEASGSGQIIMFGSADGLAIGTALVAYPGCPRTTAGCATFDNLGNYGGVPSLQGKSPFDGDPVFT